MGAFAIVVLLPIALFIAWRAAGQYPGKIFRLAVVRPFWYAQLVLPVAAIGGVIGAIIGTLSGRSGDAGRAGMAIMASIFAIVAIRAYFDSRGLRTTYQLFRFPNLPPGLDGLRIAQISDLHVGPHTPRSHLREIERMVREAKPDLIAITGDQVDDYAGDVDVYSKWFGALEAPLGVYVIPGNHDVYAGWPKVRAKLDALLAGRQTVLVNDSREVTRDGARLIVVGTGDPAAGRGGPNVDERGGVDIDATLLGADLHSPDAFVLALAHNPVLWPALAARGVPLTLSGHTHWGQFAIPLLGWSLASPFLDHAMGVYREGPSTLYIHPGTNYWGIPFRLGTPPEVGIIELRRGE
jgi:hypothetical protein